MKRARLGIRAAILLNLAAIFAVPAGAPAQQPGGGIIVGIAVDSIYGGPLRGAIIKVGETGPSAVTDSAGRYRVTGIPRGSHRVEVLHPLLDTLRLILRTVPREFGDSTDLVIATPSTTTVVALKCTPADRAAGNAMALGFVTSASSGEPVQGAVVRLEWTDYEVVGKRISSQPRSRSAVTDGDGSYRICGIPEELETGIFATTGDDTTAVTMRNFAAGLAIASFRVAAGPAGARSADARAIPPVLATVSGRVVDTLGRGVEGARVATDDGRQFTTTNGDGTFQLAGVRAGSRGLSVRKIGFLPVSQAVDVLPQGTNGVEVELAVYVPVLETVRITARLAVSLERVGFASRRRAGLGSYLGPEEIERRNPHRVNDLLRMMSGLRTYYGPGGEAVITSRGGQCVRYYVDGQRWFDGGDSPDSFMTGREVGAVEVYSSSTTPAQFMASAADGTSCAVVVLWTKWKLRI